MYGSPLSQGTGPLNRDRPVSAESAHTMPTAGESATAGPLELSWVRARPHELCPAGSAPGSQDLSAWEGGQRGLPAGPPSGASGPLRAAWEATGTPAKASSHLASCTPATLGREGESRHLRKPQSPRSTTQAHVGLSARASRLGSPREYLAHSGPPAGPLGSPGSEKL